MSLNRGTRLGPYELEAPIGAGGMGEVYRAKDTRLDRTVAVKVLPDELSRKAGLRQRFEREARAIASLSHPHICALYDVGLQDGIDFLVMEYLEGETLADRLSHGALKTEPLLRYAIQIADALDKAHRQGFVHRDLKPGNIMLTQTGVKLLDFGLAKFAADEKPLQAGVNIGATATRTMQQPLTAEGMIAGTLQYMAPEQLEGKEADARTDIFAFGAVVYEMATGKKAFDGKSQASLIAAILAAEPKPILMLQPLAPPALERVVQTCLAKDPEERWQNARDMMRELQWIAEAKAQPQEVQQQRRLGRERLAWAVAGLFFVAFLILAVLHFQEMQPERQQIRLSFQVAENARILQLSVSPDGHSVVVAVNVGDKSRLLLRPLNSSNRQELPGTEGASYPFWSPDGRFIGFFAGGKLKKVAVAGGVAETLCDAAGGRGGTWNRDGTIVFSPSSTAFLYSVAATGGVASPATVKATSGTNEVHRFPHFLPDGRHFLFMVRLAGEGKSGLYVASLDSKEARHLLAGVSNAEFIPSSPSYSQGYLLFARETTLLAQPFDAERLQPSGEVFPVAEQVSAPAVTDYFGFSTSRTGVLAYLTGIQTNELLWFDRGGKQLGTVGGPGAYKDVSLSPDEKRVAVTHGLGTAGSPTDIWIHELARDTATKFTLHPGTHQHPVWSPDGSRIAFVSFREGNQFIYQQDTSGAGKEEIVFGSKSATALPWVVDWSRDGRFLIYMAGDPKTHDDLWILPMSGDRKPVPWLQTEFYENQGQFSPDGRWVAYTSDESGSNQIYVRPFPASSSKWPISNSGGWQPRWRGDGKELFYVAPDRRLMVAAIRAGSDSTDFEASVPQPLFQTAIFQFAPGLIFMYDVTADGRRFLINTVPAGGTPPAINVVVNWQAGLK